MPCRDGACSRHRRDACGQARPDGALVLILLESRTPGAPGCRAADFGGREGRGRCGDEPLAEQCIFLLERSDRVVHLLQQRRAAAGAAGVAHGNHRPVLDILGARGEGERVDRLLSMV